MKPRSKVITIPLFDQDMLVVRGGSLSSAVRAYCKIIGFPIDGIVDNSKRRGHMLFHTGTNTLLLWLHEDAYLGTVAHEVFHAVYNILREREVPLSDDTEEVYAYLIQALVNDIMKHLFN